MTLALRTGGSTAAGLALGFVADQVLAFLEEIAGGPGDPGDPVAGREGAEQDRREDSRATD